MYLEEYTAVTTCNCKFMPLMWVGSGIISHCSRRIGLDKHLGVNFDPTSTDEREVNLFKDCIQKFQESSDLIGRCQLGVLCV